MVERGYIVFVFLASLFFSYAEVSLAQSTPQQANAQPDKERVSILESRFSTITPILGESLTYSLKFDHEDSLTLYPVEHFAEHGLRLLERKQLESQTFQGRMIQQYEYTLKTEQEGEFQFSPVSINLAGPLKNPIVSVADPVRLSVRSPVDIHLVTNSPIFLDESLELQLTFTKRQPATLTKIPPTVTAILHRSEESESAEADQQGTSDEQQPASSTPIPESSVLEFTLDQSQQIVPQQTDGQTVEHYRYLLSTPLERAGEYVIPEFTVTYRTDTGEDIQKQVEATSLFVLNPGTGNVDIRTNYRYLILPAILLVVLLLGGGLTALYLKYRRLRREQHAGFAPTLSPGEIAHQELSAIQAMKLPAQGEFKRYYFLLSETVRKFLGAEYRFRMLERTTEEILDEIQRRDIPEEIRREIRTFLPEADLVKFAKYVPPLAETEHAMEQAVKIVDDSLAYHRPVVVNDEPVEVLQPLQTSNEAL